MKKILTILLMLCVASIVSATFVFPSTSNNSTLQSDDFLIINWTTGYYSPNCGEGGLSVITQNISAGYWNDMVCHTDYELPAWCGGTCAYNNTLMSNYEYEGDYFPNARLKPIYLRINDSESILFINLVDKLRTYEETQNKSEIYLTEEINLSTSVTDGSGLMYAVFQTNETGSWSNISSLYLNNVSYEEKWTNFTWSNTTEPLNKTVGWKICFNNSRGKTNCTTEKSFKLVSDLVKPEIDQTRTCYNTSKLKFKVTDLGFGMKNVTTNITANFNSIGNDEWESESEVLDGNYTVAVNATDKNNNSNSTSFNITVGSTYPDVSIDLSDGETYDSTQNLEINVSGASQTLYNDVYEGVSGKFNKVLTLSEGLNTFKIKAIGSCGNERIKYLNLTKKTKSSASVGSGGGGGGSIFSSLESPQTQTSKTESVSLPPEPVTVSVEKSETKTISQISAGQSSVVSFSSSSVRYVEIRVNNQATDIKISVKEVNETPKVSVEKKVYKTLEIETENLTDISGANITFDVENGWLNNNNIGKASIKMLRNHSGQWETLDTELLSETENKTFYKAHSKGFSTFVIVGETAATPTPTTIPPSEKQEGFWRPDKVLGAIIFIVASVLLICIWQLRRINKQLKRR